MAGGRIVTAGKHRVPPTARNSRRATLVFAGCGAVTAAGLLAPAQSGAADTPALAGTGVITMVHAVPGLVADVSVDGKSVLTGFTASRVTDPVTLSAGTHTVALKADNGKSAGKTVLTAKLDVTAGTTSTAVVGLTPAGAAKAFVFPEMAVPVASGQAAFVLRNVAATSPVKIVVDGKPFTTGTLGSGAVTTADVAPGTHQVTVKSAAGKTILAAQGADLQAGRVTTLYLTGSQKGHDLSWVATTRLASSLIPLSTIPTGDGSTVDAIVTSRNNISVGVAGSISVIIGAAAYPILRRRARARAFT
jgi:hypothetical protein